MKFVLLISIVVLATSSTTAFEVSEARGLKSIDAFCANPSSPVDDLADLVDDLLRTKSSFVSGVDAVGYPQAVSVRDRFAATATPFPSILEAFVRRACSAGRDKAEKDCRKITFRNDSGFEVEVSGDSTWVVVGVVAILWAVAATLGLVGVSLRGRCSATAATHPRLAALFRARSAQQEAVIEAAASAALAAPAAALAAPAASVATPAASVAPPAASVAAPAAPAASRLASASTAPFAASAAPTAPEHEDIEDSDTETLYFYHP